MVDLLRRALPEQIGAGCAGAGVAVRVLDLAAQFYVSCDQTANTRRGEDPYTLWLAPDRALQVGGAPPPGFVSDMSDGLAIFEITGPRAGEIVAMGCTLDHALLAPGRCAQTVFAGVKAIIYSFGQVAFRIHVERQLATFTLQWLTQAATALQ